MRTNYERELGDLHSVIDDLRNELGEIRRQQAEPSEWLARVTAHRIIVHQRTNSSIEGLLTMNLRDGIVLRQASLLNPGGQKTPMAGEVFVPREEIILVQFDG